MASMHVSLTVWCWHYYKKTHRYIIGLIEKVPAGDTLVSSCPPAHCLIITLTITYHTSWYCREQHELVLLSRCSTSDSCLTTLLPCGSLLTCAVTHRCASITRDDKFPIRHSCGLLLRYRSVLVSVTNLTEMWLMSSLWWNLNNQGEILQYLNSTIKYQAGVFIARAADHEEFRVVGLPLSEGELVEEQHVSLIYVLCHIIILTHKMWDIIFCEKKNLKKMDTNHVIKLEGN